MLNVNIFLCNTQPYSITIANCIAFTPVSCQYYCYDLNSMNETKQLKAILYVNLVKVIAETVSDCQHHLPMVAPKTKRIQNFHVSVDPLAVTELYIN